MGGYTFNIIKEEIRRMRKNVVLMTVLMVALVFALMSVAVPAVGADDVACDWTGTWDTCWGKMELVQTGNQVTGTASLTLPQRTNLTGSYKQDKGDKILGRVFDNALRGVWLRYPNDPPENSGNIVFIISEDCSSFDGKWQYGLREYGEEKWDSSSSNWDGDWTGSRVGPSKPPSKPPSKQTVCASAKISITDGSEFTTAEFTIGGTEPQKVRITQPAENFGIVNVYGGKYGGRVYQRIKGESWGSLTLEPGTYRLSCSGGGVMDLDSATVCIEYPAAEEVPPKQEEKEKPPMEEKEKPPMEEVKPSLPRGPIEKIIILPEGNLAATELTMEIGKKQRFSAWGEDAAGHDIRVTVKDWEVNDMSIGSIDKDGLFEAIFEAKAEGNVKIRATVKNQEGNDITGAFPITVTKEPPEPPITFVGRVKFFDQNGRYTKPLAGVQVLAIVMTSKSAAASFLDVVATVKTSSTGEFKFVLPAKYKDVDEWNFHSWGLKIPAPSGYVWCCWSGSSFDAPGKPGKTYHIDPFECNLGEVKFWIEGMVTHHGKAVEPAKNAKVMLFDNGNCVKKTLIKYDGEFTLDVSNLPKGSYRLTVKPYKLKGRVSVHDWLYIKKDKWVELPLPTETKTIDIEMISFAEKVGYTGP
jgi:hypothetical protein